MSFIEQTVASVSNQPLEVQREVLFRLAQLVDLSDVEVVNPERYGGRIIKTPGVVGGSARIFNRRLPVYGLIECYQLGWTDERLLESYPFLTIEDLTAAKTYYADHREEIDLAIILNNAA